MMALQAETCNVIKKLKKKFKGKKPTSVVYRTTAHKLTLSLLSI
jgi:hypothetical protein